MHARKKQANRAQIPSEKQLEQIKDGKNIWGDFEKPKPKQQSRNIDLEINTDKPSKLEIVTETDSLKNNKASGNNNLPAEIFKADPTLAAGILYPLFRKIWKNNNISTTWR